MEVTLLLCDAAQSADGKLYVMGAGWNEVAADIPFSMSLAVLVSVPWDRTNQKISAAAKLMTEDGAPVQVAEQEVGATAEFELGRPPGSKPGSSFNVPMALGFGGIALPAGGYRWEFEVNGTQMATAPFRAVSK